MFIRCIAYLEPCQFWNERQYVAGYLCSVVSPGVIRELFQGVVSSYKEGLAFYSRWSDVLDSGAMEHNPKVLWKQPTVALNDEGNGLVTEAITMDVLILDQTAQDRTPTERDLTYERLQIIASHLWVRFRELYVLEEAVYQGVNISLSQSGPAQFTAIWDNAAEMTTGCRMVVTVTSPYQFCASDYFNEA